MPGIIQLGQQFSILAELPAGLDHSKCDASMYDSHNNSYIVLSAHFFFFRQGTPYFSTMNVIRQCKEREISRVIDPSWVPHHSPKPVKLIISVAC